MTLRIKVHHHRFVHFHLIQSFFYVILLTLISPLWGQGLPSFELPVQEAKLPLDQGDSIVLNLKVSSNGWYDLLLGFTSVEGGKWSLMWEETGTLITQNSIPNTAGHDWHSYPGLQQVRLPLEAGHQFIRLRIDQVPDHVGLNQPNIMFQSAKILPAIHRHISLIVGGKTSGYADGSATEALFSDTITGLTLLPDSTVIVADAGNHRLRHISPNGHVTTFAGNGEPKSIDGRGTGASFGEILSLTSDAMHTIYILERGNRSDDHIVLRVIDLKGNVSTLRSNEGESGFYRDAPTRLIQTEQDLYLLSRKETGFRGWAMIERIQTNLQATRMIFEMDQSHWRPDITDAIVSKKGSFLYLRTAFTSIPGFISDLISYNDQGTENVDSVGQVMMSMFRYRMNEIEANDRGDLVIAVGEGTGPGINWAEYSNRLLRIDDTDGHSPQEFFRSKGWLSSLKLGRNGDFVIVEGDPVLQSRTRTNTRILFGSFQSTPFNEGLRIRFVSMTNQEVHLKVETGIHQSIHIQQSIDLKSWQDTGMFGPNENGIIIIPRGQTSESQFFRAMLLD